MTVAYDGTAYAGWQRQTNGVAIQQLFEEALLRIVGRETRVVGSGRTDAGVHAKGQVCSFRTQTSLAPDSLARALQANVPHDVVVLDVRETLPDFHAQRCAKGKRYRYCIDDGPAPNPFLARYAWRSFRPLDAERMQLAAARLVGTHDFKSFEAKGSERKSTVRTITHSRVVREETAWGEAIWFEVAANGFLYRMVRNLVGLLFKVGRRACEPEWVEEVLAARTRTQKYPTAPPQGLFLWSVDYPAKYDGATSADAEQGGAGQGRGEGAGDEIAGDEIADEGEPA
jgi:tRNA pseudouridine38-40 synthase